MNPPMRSRMGTATGIRADKAKLGCSTEGCCLTVQSVRREPVRNRNSPKRGKRLPRCFLFAATTVAVLLLLACTVLSWLSTSRRPHNNSFAIQSNMFQKSNTASTSARRRQQPNGFFSGNSQPREQGGLKSISSQEEFAFDYNLPPVATSETLPDPKRPISVRLIVLVLSARENLERRSVIRQTWGKGHAVYFVIGGSERNSTAVQDSRRSTQLQELLQNEQEVNHDLLDTIHPDSYQSLPHKLRFALHWVDSNCDDATPVDWILKVDDDMFVRVDRFMRHDSFLKLLNPASLVVVGRILSNVPVQRNGKWADATYFKTNPIYPPWPQGSCGYVVSRAVAQYIAQWYDQNLARTLESTQPMLMYQGEDTSLGIWLKQSGLDVFWLLSPYFVNDGDCMVDSTSSATTNSSIVAWSIGHRITPAQMRKCHEADAKHAAGDMSMASSMDRLLYLESLDQHNALTRTRLGNVDGHDGAGEYTADSIENESYRSAIEHYEWDRNVEKRLDFNLQRKEQRVQKRNQLRAGK